MGFPYSAHANFETGQLAAGSEWTSQTDTDSRLSNMHYSELAKYSTLEVGPYRGAFCMAAKLGSGTNPAYVENTAGIDLTTGTDSMWMRFQLYVSNNVTMANNDEFSLAQIRSASADEATISLSYTTASGLKLGLSADGSSTTKQTGNFTTGSWHTVEWHFVPDTGSSGATTLYLDGVQVATVTDLTNATTTHWRMGLQDKDAGTTDGWVLYDEIIVDSGTAPTRTFPNRDRFPKSLLLQKSGHAFVGPGKVCNVTLLGGTGTTDIVQIFDTDTALGTTSLSSSILRLRNTAANEVVDPAGTPLYFHRGCYVSIGGTATMAMIDIDRASGYVSDGAIRTLGSKYKRDGFNTELVTE